MSYTIVITVMQIVFVKFPESADQRN